MFQIGLPIGILTSFVAELSGVCQVASHTSDVPYRLYKVAAGITARKRAYNSEERYSPLLTQNLRSGRRDSRSGNESTSAWSSEGTSQIRVTQCRRRIRTKLSRSLTSSSAKMTVGVPTSSPPKISHSESIKPMAVL